MCHPVSDYVVGAGVVQPHVVAKTLQGRVRVEPEPIKNSRFIATAAAVSSEAEAKALLADVTAQMPDANHHCAAWRIANPAIDRALDAGEPSGSAGRPILAQLSGRDLVDVCVVVSRYFGGVKLGVGGLVRAYGGAAAEALDAATIVDRVETTQAVLEHGYEDGPAVQRVLDEHGVDVVQTDYGGAVTRRVAMPSDPAARAAIETALADATAGRVRVRDSSS